MDKIKILKAAADNKSTTDAKKVFVYLGKEITELMTSTENKCKTMY